MSKLEDNRPKCTRWSTETNFLHESRAITLCLFDEIYPATIPNHSYQISTRIQSLKKICQEMLKIESGNEVVTDGQTLNANF